MQTVSVSIMAHPARADQVSKLQSKLDRPSVVTWDQKQDRIDTGTRALLSYDREATHHCVIQDDAIVPRDLITGIEKILNSPSMRKDVPLCLYAGNIKSFVRRFRQAERNGVYSWLLMSGLNWGVAVVIPTLEIDPLVSFMLNPVRREPQYDLRMSRYFEFKRIAVWYPIPSLVDHQHGPSLLGQGDRRSAWKFIGEDASALDFKDTRKSAYISLTRRFIG